MKIKAFGLNRMDLLQREGKYPVPPQAPPTLGVEFSGVIEEAAEGTDGDFKAGDEVFGLTYGGESLFMGVEWLGLGWGANEGQVRMRSTLWCRRRCWFISRLSCRGRKRLVFLR